MKITFATVASLAMFTSAIWAQTEGDADQAVELRQQIELQKRQLEALNTRLDAVKEDAEATKEERSVPEWVQRMKIKGDIRARFEDVRIDGDVSKSRFRERVRLGVFGEVNDQMDWGFRIASGSDERPTSSNQSIGDYSNKRRIWMDLGYFDYTPRQMESLNAIIGKFKFPWLLVSDVMWDSDVNPEGLNLKYDAHGLVAQAGYYPMQDGRDGDPEKDIAVSIAQLAGTKELAEDVKLTLAGTASIWSHIQGANVAEDDNGNPLSKGNTVVKEENEDGTDDAFYVNGYEILDGSLKLDVARGHLPFKVYGQYLVNLDADQDTGWKAGVGTRINKVGLDYNYRDVEADAVVGLLADSDFGGGGAAVRGHRIKARYKLLENCELALTAMIAENTGKDTDVNTVQGDIVIKF